MGDSRTSPRWTVWIWRLIPISLVVMVASLLAGSEVVTPHQRTVKITALFILLVIMWRFEMIYSLFLFIFLFPFPAGIALNNTNVILMTLILLLWVIRANSAGMKIFYKTGIDGLIGVFVLAYLVSFFNIDETRWLRQAAQLFWRELSAIALFYLIVRFVTDEKKLSAITKVIALSAGFVAFTGIVELFFPGSTLIPGWIQLVQKGELGTRIESVRLGGAVKSHGLLSDLCTLTLFPMGYHFLRAKNPIEKTLWVGVIAMTFVVLLATANRGAFFAFLIAVLYSLYVFRSRLNFVQYVVAITSMVAAFAVGHFVLDRYTHAASITARISHTEFSGFVPDTRVGTWKPALIEATNHIFIGHGPVFRQAVGLEFMFWPHNAYIYYLYTVGLFGTTAFLLILYKLFRMSLRYRSPAVTNTFLGVMMGILHIDLIIFAVEQMRTDHQRNADYVYMYIVWMLFGVIVATYKLIGQREREIAGRGADAETPGAPGAVETGPASAT